MRQTEIKAYAKINLTLDVAGRRPDGYHELVTVMHSISLCDRITVTLTGGSGITVSTDLPELSCGKNNLAYTAAQLFFEKTRISGGADIKIEKNIPVAAGLAGGSADAAAVLRALNILCDGALSPAEALKAGLIIGSDVPFCLTGGCVLARGRGEIMTSLPSLPDCTLLVATPDLYVSTREVFESLSLSGMREHPDTNGMLSALKGENLHEISVRMYNVLETVTARSYPIIEKIKSVMLDGGALGSIMSGSGSSVFGIFEDCEKAVFTAKQLEPFTKSAFIAKPVA